MNKKDIKRSLSLIEEIINSGTVDSNTLSNIQLIKQKIEKEQLDNSKINKENIKTYVVLILKLLHEFFKST